MDVLYIPEKLLMYKDGTYTTVEVHDGYKRLITKLDKKELIEVVKWLLETLDKELTRRIRTLQELVHIDEDTKKKIDEIIKNAEDARGKLIPTIEVVERILKIL